MHTHNHDTESNSFLSKERKTSLAIASIIALGIVLTSVIFSSQIANFVFGVSNSEAYKNDEFDPAAGGKYYLAQIESIEEQNIAEAEDTSTDAEPLSLEESAKLHIEAKILSGNAEGKQIELNISEEEYELFKFENNKSINVGEKIIVTEGVSTMHLPNESDDIEIGPSVSETIYYFQDTYRLEPVIILIAIFFALSIVFAGWRGFTSIIGLGASLFILVSFVVPNIINGNDPLVVSLLGAIVIAVSSLFLAHGFNKRTSLALASTLITIFIAAILAVIFVNAAKLFGVGTEEALILQANVDKEINLEGLLLGGIIIGALGVLDDITTAQTAVVEELKKANKKFTFLDLFTRGLSVGKEHVSALVNTLVLAYAGSSFPLFILFVINDVQPLWVIFNNEFIIEEIVRTLVGSSTLIFSVPISTFIAAWFYGKAER